MKFFSKFAHLFFFKIALFVLLFGFPIFGYFAGSWLIVQDESSSNSVNSQTPRGRRNRRAAPLPGSKDYLEYQKRKAVFEALVVGSPASRFENGGEKIKVGWEDTWNLTAINGHITVITNEITRLEGLYRRYSGIYKDDPGDNWPAKSVNTDGATGDDYPTLKEAQTAVTNGKVHHDAFGNVFKALTIDDPASVFENSENIKVVLENTWNLETLWNHITTITTEITHLEQFYRQYSGIAKGAAGDNWPAKSVNTDGATGDDYPTLKAAQTAVTNVKVHYDALKEVFDFLTIGDPDSAFENSGNIKVDSKNSWNLETLKNHITTITSEITRLEGLYRQYSGIAKGATGDKWPTNTVNTDGNSGADYPFLFVAQRRVRDAKTYSERVKVFNALVADNPAGNLEGRNIGVVLDPTWDLAALNKGIDDITDGIKHLRGIYINLGGEANVWNEEPVVDNTVHFTFKNAEEKITATRLALTTRGNVFKALVVGSPASRFENGGEKIKVLWEDTWNLKAINGHITVITTEITRLEGLYRRYSDVAWLPSDKTVDTNGDNTADYPTLKAAQTAVTNGKVHYDALKDVFKALTIDDPASVFENSGNIKVDLENTWNLETLKNHITTITSEITRLEGLYRQYSGIAKGATGDKWPTNTVNTDGNSGADYPFLFVAQRRVRDAKTYSERVKVFNALVADNPAGNLEGRNIGVVLDPTWDLAALNKGIDDITDGIKHLRGIYINLGGEANVWNEEPVVDNTVHFTFKNAEEKITATRLALTTRGNVFKALVVGSPASRFENGGEKIKVLWEDTWNLKAINGHITVITTEITRLEGLYRQYSGIDKDDPDDNWPAKSVNTDGATSDDYPTLKAAQTAVTNGKVHYDALKDVFEALTIDNPAPAFENGGNIKVVLENTWNLETLWNHITTITTEITHLEQFYRQYSGIAKGATGDNWPANTVNTDGATGDDYPTLKDAQTAVTNGKVHYDAFGNVFEALTIDSPAPAFENSGNIKVLSENTWNLETLKNHITTITTEITRLEKLYRQYSGIAKGAAGDNWPAKSVNTDGVAGNDFPTLKAAQDKLGETLLPLKQLREIYIRLGGIKSVFPVKNGIFTIKATDAFELVKKVIQSIKDQKAVFLNLIDQFVTPAEWKADEKTFRTTWPNDLKIYDLFKGDETDTLKNLFKQGTQDELLIPDLTLATAIAKTTWINEEKTRLKNVFLAKGGKIEGWKDVFTLKEAVDKENSQNTIFDQVKSFFVHLLPIKPKALYGISEQIVPYPGDDAATHLSVWNVEKFIMEIDIVLTEIEKLSTYLYLRLGGAVEKLQNGTTNPNGWTQRAALRYATIHRQIFVNKNYATTITLASAQKKATDLIKEINDLRKRFVLLTAGTSNLKPGEALPVWPVNDIWGIPALDFDQATNNVDKVNKQIDTLKQEFIGAQGKAIDWGSPTLQEAEDKVKVIRLRKNVLLEIYTDLKKDSDEAVDSTWDLTTVTNKIKGLNDAILVLKNDFINLEGINWPGTNPAISQILSTDDIQITHEEATVALANLNEEIKNKKVEWESLKGAATQIKFKFAKAGVNIPALPDPLTRNTIVQRIEKINVAITELKTTFDKLKGEETITWTDADNNTPDLEEAQNKVKALSASISVEKGKYETLTAGLNAGDSSGVTDEIKYEVWPSDDADGNPTINLSDAKKLVEKYEQEMIRLKTDHKDWSGTEVEWNNPQPTSIKEALDKIETAKEDLWEKIKTYEILYNQIYRANLNSTALITKSELKHGAIIIPWTFPPDLKDNKKTYGDLDNWNKIRDIVKNALAEINKLKIIYDECALPNDVEKWEQYDLEKILEPNQIHTTISAAIKKIDNLLILIATEKIHFDYLTKGAPSNVKISEDSPVFITWPQNVEEKVCSLSLSLAQKQKQNIMTEIKAIYDKFVALGGATTDLHGFADPAAPWAQFNFSYRYDSITSTSSGITLKQAQAKLNHLIALINAEKKRFEVAYEADVVEPNASNDANTSWPADDAMGIPTLSLDQAKAKVAYWGADAVRLRIDAIAEKFRHLGGKFEQTPLTDADDAEWPIIANNYNDEKTRADRWVINEAQARRKLQDVYNVITLLKEGFHSFKGTGVNAASEYKDKSPIMDWPPEIDWGNQFTWLVGSNNKGHNVDQVELVKLSLEIVKMSNEVKELKKIFQSRYEGQGYTTWQSETAKISDVDGPWPTTPQISLSQARAKVAYWAPAEVKKRIKKLFELYFELKKSDKSFQILTSDPQNVLSPLQKQANTPWPHAGAISVPVSDDNIALTLLESEAEAKLRFVIGEINQKRLDFLKLMKGVDYNNPLSDGNLPTWPSSNPIKLVKDKNIWTLENAVVYPVINILFDWHQKLIKETEDAFLALAKDSSVTLLGKENIYVKNHKGTVAYDTPWPLKDKTITLAQAIAKYDYWEPFAVEKRIRSWRKQYHNLGGVFSYGKSNLKKDDALLSASSAWPMSGTAFNDEAGISLKYYQAKAKLERLIAQRIIDLNSDDKSTSSNNTTVIILAVSTAIFGVCAIAALGWIGYSFKMKSKSPKAK